MSRKLMLNVRVCIAESEWHLGRTLFSCGPMSSNKYVAFLDLDLDAG
jgi:hypothetical protein